MFSERTSVGLDVHARSVAAAAIDGVTGEVFQSRLTPSYEDVRSWIARLPGPVALAYEAGPTGFGLYRALTAAGLRCEVVAPSKLQKPAGAGLWRSWTSDRHLICFLSGCVVAARGSTRETPMSRPSG